MLRGLAGTFGPLHATVEELQLRGAQVALDAQGLRSLAADTAVLRGLVLEGRLPSQAPAPARVELSALAGLEGMLRVFVTDAAWIVDADITLPVQHGRLDFNRVVIEHVGPNSAMGIGRGGVYVDAPNLGRRYLYLFTAAELPGLEVQGEGRGRAADRGRLEIEPFLQGLFRKPAQALGRPADLRLFATLLARTRLAGELQCGDGVLAAAGARIVLSGKATGRNRMGLSAPVLGRELLLRLPELQAAEAAWVLPQLQLHTGAVTGHAELRLQRDAHRGARLQARMEHATVHGLRLVFRRSASRAPAAAPARAHSA